MVPGTTEDVNKLLILVPSSVQLVGWFNSHVWHCMESTILCIGLYFSELVQHYKQNKSDSSSAIKLLN